MKAINKKYKFKLFIKLTKSTPQSNRQYLSNIVRDCPTPFSLNAVIEK